MRVLVSGSRAWRDALPIYRRLEELPHGSLVIHGDAPGADTIADVCAQLLGFEVDRHPARWRENGVYNPNAGKERNTGMLDLFPDLVIAFQVGRSSGTQDTIDKARARGIETEVHHS